MFKNRPPQIYRRRPGFRLALKIVGIVLALIVAAAIFLFFWLRQYAVYLPDGTVEIVFPWSES
jgi:hypothetical protein